MLKFTEKVKGHDLIQNQICKALEQNRLPHALLFSGPSGVGKKYFAWELAKSLLCEKTSSLSKEGESLSFLERSQRNYKACGFCLSCRSIEKKQSEHVLEITHESLQIRLQDLQSVLSFLSLQSFAKAKIVLIDSAEKLNSYAFNFLLKIIEEPPPKSFFFLISSQSSRLSLTLRSRVQNILFSPLSEELLTKLSSPDTEKWMIKSSQGQMDLLQEFKEKKELRNLAFDLLLECFNKKSLDIDFKVIKDRKTALDILRFWRFFLRDLRLLGLSRKDKLIHRDQIERMRKLADFSKEHLDLWIKNTLEMEYELQSNFDRTLCFENFAINLKKSLQFSIAPLET
ncbi:MAG: hypothetical protein GDA46_05950 [Bdellovibrionales bacterium]|nr:hypothetical protein [Bdellovibrionales bacterium]